MRERVKDIYIKTHEEPESSGERADDEPATPNIAQWAGRV